jgi:hypothetical protein
VGRAGAAELPVTVPLVWRRQLPLLVVLVQFASILVIHDIGLVALVAALAGAYALAAHGPRPLVSLAILVGMPGSSR